MKQTSSYTICVEGHLSTNRADWFEPFAISRKFDDDGGKPITILSGTVDQAALHGALIKIRDMNLILIAVNRIQDAVKKSEEQKEHS